MQRKLQRSVTEMRRSRSGRPRRSIEPQRSRVAFARRCRDGSAAPCLVLVTAVWGITFVQIKDALELYPLFAFLAVRFAIAVAVLAVPAAPRAALARSRRRGRGRAARRAARGRLRAPDGRARADDGLRRGLRDRDVRRADAGLRRSSSFASARRGRCGSAWRSRSLGLAMLSGVSAGSTAGDLLVLAGAALYALQIALDGALRAALRPARVHDGGDGRGIRRLRGRRRGARGRSRFRAARPCGARCSSRASSRARSRYLVQAWAQQRTSATRTALVFSLEPVFAGHLRLRARRRPARRDRLGRAAR